MHNIIYLMGAGRSGTTALASFLGNNKDIRTLGELHQFFNYLEEHQQNSSPAYSDFWQDIFTETSKKLHHIPEANASFINSIEYHSNILPQLTNLYPPKNQQKYLDIQETVFSIIKHRVQKTYMLDSSKYIGRYLALNKSSELNIKAIYMVRDVRGVIWSFQKKVQTPYPPLKTVLYYNIINLLAELTRLFKPRKSILKIRYEDVMNHPQESLSKIEHFLAIDLSDVKTTIQQNTPFQIPDIIGGNRLKHNKTIYLKKDFEWQKKLSRPSKFLYYLLCLPFMMLNRYHPFK